MKVVLAILFLAGVARGEVPAGWGTDFDKALSAQRPALVFFTASWCGPCKMMARGTLADGGVRRELSGFEDVAVDIDEHSDLASKYGVEAVPTFVVLAKGVEIERTTGYEGVADFTQWCASSGSEAREEMTRQTMAAKSLAEVDGLLAATGTDGVERAAGELFELCDERDPGVVAEAAERLRLVAGRDAGVLLEGLEDPRLATRIEVANVLREKLGEGFAVDPWSDAGTREKGIEDWRGRIK